MNQISKLIMLVLMIVGLQNSVLAQTASDFTCEGLEMISGGTPENPQWTLMEEVTKVELYSTLTPLWDLKVYGSNDEILLSDMVGGVGYYFDLSELDSETLEIISIILNTKALELHSYQLYPIFPDAEDNVGFKILEFFKLENKKIVPAGAVFFQGWGYGRCVNHIVK